MKQSLKADPKPLKQTITTVPNLAKYILKQPRVTEVSQESDRLSTKKNENKVVSGSVKSGLDINANQPISSEGYEYESEEDEEEEEPVSLRKPSPAPVKPAPPSKFQT